MQWDHLVLPERKNNRQPLECCANVRYSLAKDIADPTLNQSGTPLQYHQYKEKTFTSSRPDVEQIEKTSTKRTDRSPYTKKTTSSIQKNVCESRRKTPKTLKNITGQQDRLTLDCGCTAKDLHSGKRRITWHYQYRQIANRPTKGRGNTAFSTFKQRTSLERRINTGW